MKVPKYPDRMEPETTLIFETVHGSRAYGLARAGSDTDLKGIMVGPPAWYFAPEPGPEQIELRGGDHVHFELRKFFRLAMAGNPTLLEVLWTDPCHHTVVTPAGQRLLQALTAFLSQSRRPCNADPRSRPGAPLCRRPSSGR